MNFGFYVTLTLGYAFALPPSIEVEGSALLCGRLPMHQLERRQPKHRLRSRRGLRSRRTRIWRRYCLTRSFTLQGWIPIKARKAPRLCGATAAPTLLAGNSAGSPERRRATQALSELPLCARSWILTEKRRAVCTKRSHSVGLRKPACLLSGARAGARRETSTLIRGPRR